MKVLLNIFVIFFLQKAADDHSTYESANVTAEQTTEYESAITSDLLDTYIISDSEENEVHYIVCLEPTNTEMILVVSDVSMREKDVINGR